MQGILGIWEIQEIQGIQKIKRIQEIYIYKSKELYFLIITMDTFLS